MAHDSNTSHYAGPDNLESQVDGTRTVFKLSNRNVVSGNSFYIQDNGAVAQAIPSDLLNGLATQPTAPKSSLEWYYYYQNLTDPEIQHCLDCGLTQLGMNESSLPTIDETLFHIAEHYAVSEYAQILMSRFAENFTSNVEGETYDQSDIYKAYKALHDSHFTDANLMRDEFYQRQGRKFQSYSNRSAPNYLPTFLYPRR